MLFYIILGVLLSLMSDAVFHLIVYGTHPWPIPLVLMNIALISTIFVVIIVFIGMRKK